MTDESSHPKNDGDEPSVIVDPILITEGKDTVDEVEVEIEVTTEPVTEAEAEEIAEAVNEETKGEEEDSEAEEIAETAPVEEDDEWREREREAEELLNREEPGVEVNLDSNPSKWLTRVSIAVLVLIIGGLLLLAVVGGANCADVDGNGSGADITKAVPTPTPTPPPAKAQPAPAKTPVVVPIPAPVPTTPPGVTGTVDTTLQGVNVDAVDCRTHVQLLEQGGKILLRTTYSCPPTAIEVVTGNE